MAVCGSTVNSQFNKISTEYTKAGFEGSHLRRRGAQSHTFNSREEIECVTGGELLAWVLAASSTLPPKKSKLSSRSSRANRFFAGDFESAGRSEAHRP